MLKIMKDQRFINALQKAIDKSNEEVHALRMDGKYEEAFYEYEYGRGLSMALRIYVGMREAEE